MKYAINTYEQRKNDRKAELIDLWMKSDTFEQFWIQQSIRIPDATANELRAFRIHRFKTCHPVLYPFLWILWLVLSVSPGVFLSIPPLAGAVCVGLYYTIVLMHFILHADMMGTIKWHEDGKPTEY